MDKDLAAAILAKDIGADVFVISTAVEKVCLNYNKPNEKRLDTITVEEAEKYMGRKADKNRKIYNGMIRTYCYQFMGPRPPRRKKQED